MIPITKVDVSDSEDLVIEVLRSGNLAQGPMVARLEKEFAEAIHVRNCVAVNNGTTALMAALEVCDLKPGDEVITSPFTFVATLNAAVKAGAIVRFADISEKDFNISADSIAKLINDRTAVLMPVHLYGQCADMDEILPLATNNNLALIEDAAQAHGAKIGNRFAGTFGTGCFSLYATKNITSAEGGLITTNDDGLAERLRVLRNQGMRDRYQYEMVGNNYRLTDIHAAIAIPQVSKIQEIASKRQKNAQYLSKHLSSCKFISTPAQVEGRTHVWHQYTIVLNNDSPVDRDEFILRMKGAGVFCGAYYPRLVFDYSCFLDHPNVITEDLPVARHISSNCVSLPVHQYLSTSELDKIIESTFTVLC